MNNRDISFKLDNIKFNLRTSGLLVYKNNILLHRKIEDNFFVPIGGRVKLQENSEVALIREFREELGILIEIEKLLFIVENFPMINNEKYHEICFIYKVRALNVNKILLEYDSFVYNNLEFKWFKLEELLCSSTIFKPEFLNSCNNWLPDRTQHIINL